MYPIIAALLLGATPAGPLTATHSVVDRGEVRTGPQLIQTFELTHGGSTGDIHIIGLEAGCGCLKPSISRNMLHPGERAELTLTVNTLTQPPGPNTWRVVVRYRTGETTAEQALTVKATLIREVSVTPPMLAISTTGTVTQTITVTDCRATPLTVQSAATTNPHLTATVQLATMVKGLHTQTIAIAVAADYPVGQFDETLTLVTTDPACRELRVPIRVAKRKPGAVKTTPAELDIRFAQRQAEASGLLQLRRPGGGLVRIQRVECEHAALRARWPSTAGPVVTVRVIVNAAKAENRSGKATVRILMAEPSGEPVIIPVSWSIR